jgi:putative transposase
MAEHLRSIGVTPDGIRYVTDSATSAPSRKVRSGPHKNLIGERHTNLATSLKLSDSSQEGVGRLQFESHSVEFAFIASLEFEANSLLVLDQPLGISLEIVNRSNRRQRVPYTADFLVVTNETASIIQLKRKEDALSLVRDRPTSWSYEGNQFHYMAADSYFEKLGLRHLVKTDEDYPWLLAQNLDLLSRTYTHGPAPIERDIEDVGRFVARHSPCSISKIVSGCHLSNAVPVLEAIRTQRVHVGLKLANLSDPHSAFVCSTIEQAAVVSLGLSSVQVTAASHDTVTIEETCDPRHADELGLRLAVATGKLDASTAGVSLRSAQRYRRAYQTGGICALAPKWYRSGKRGFRITPWHQETVCKQIREDRSADVLISRAQSYLAYKHALAGLGNDGSAPISARHYERLWSKRRNNADDARGVGGNRFANEQAPHLAVDNRAPVATRPFQVAHIDHCFAPTLAASEAAPNLDRERLPILSALVDDWLSEPIAWIIRTRHPNAETDLILLRACIRKYGRLPEAIFSDGGGDFKGNVFTHALANFGVHWICRSPSNPRQGHVVERTFGTFADTVCRGSAGYVPDWKRIRSVSSSKRAGNRQRRDFDDLQQHTDDVLGNVIPNLPRDDGAPCARVQREQYELLYGRQGVPASFDLRTLILTSAPLEETSARVNPAGSFWTPHGRYFSDVLAGSDVSLKSLSPRPDCEDRSVIYFLLKGVWHVAKSAAAIQQRGRSDSSIAATAATRTRDKAARQKRCDMLHAGFVARAQNETPGPDCRSAPTKTKEERECVPPEQTRSAAAPPKPIGDIFSWAKSIESKRP